MADDLSNSSNLGAPLRDLLHRITHQTRTLPNPHDHNGQNTADEAETVASNERIDRENAEEQLLQYRIHTVVMRYIDEQKLARNSKPPQDRNLDDELAYQLEKGQLEDDLDESREETRVASAALEQAQHDLRITRQALGIAREQNARFTMSLRQSMETKEWMREQQKKIVGHIKVRLHNSEQELTKIHDEKLELEKGASDANNQINELNKAKQSLEDQLRHSREEVNRLKDEVTSRTRVVDGANKQIHDLNDTRQSLEDQLRHSGEEIDRLKDEVASKTRMLDDASKDLDRLKGEVASKANALDGASKEIQDLNDTKQSLKDESRRSREEVDRLKGDVASKTGALDDANDQIRQLDTTKKILEDRLLLSSEASGRLECEISALKQASETARAQIDSLLQEKSSFETNFIAALGDTDRYQDKIDFLTNAQSQLQQTNASLQTALAAAQTASQNATQRAQSLEQRLQNCTAQAQLFFCVALRQTHLLHACHAVTQTLIPREKEAQSRIKTLETSKAKLIKVSNRLLLERNRFRRMARASGPFIAICIQQILTLNQRQADLDTTSTERDELRQQLNQSRTALEVSNLTLNQCQVNQESLQALLDTTSIERDETRRVARVSAPFIWRCYGISKQLNQSQAALADSGRAFRGVAIQRNRLRDRLNNTLIELFELRQTVNQSRATLAESDQKAKEALDSRDVAQADLGNLQTMFETTSIERDELRQQLDQSRAALEESNLTLNQCQADQDNLQTRLDTTSIERDGLQQQLNQSRAALEEELDSHQKSLNEAEDYRHKLVQATRTKDHVKNLLRAQIAAHNTVQRKVRRQRRTISTIRRECVGLQGTQRGLIISLIDARMHFRNLRETYNFNLNRRMVRELTASHLNLKMRAYCDALDAARRSLHDTLASAFTDKPIAAEKPTTYHMGGDYIARRTDTCIQDFLVQFQINRQSLADAVFSCDKLKTYNSDLAKSLKRLLDIHDQDKHLVNSQEEKIQKLHGALQNCIGKFQKLKTEALAAKQKNLDVFLDLYLAANN